MMNGAVASAMCFYGDKYGLNYGVSLPTIRDIAKGELSKECDSVANHALSRLLYRQDVRELKLAAFWLCDIDMLLGDSAELDFWLSGIVNSEMAEEAAFTIFGNNSCSNNRYNIDIKAILSRDSELLHYCAMLSCANCGTLFDDVKSLWTIVVELLCRESNLLPKGVVILLESLLKQDNVSNDDILSLVKVIPEECRAKNFIVEEISWRLEFR